MKIFQIFSKCLENPATDAPTSDMNAQCHRSILKVTVTANHLFSHFCLLFVPKMFQRNKTTEILSYSTGTERIRTRKPPTDSPVQALSGDVSTEAKFPIFELTLTKYSTSQAPPSFIDSATQYSTPHLTTSRPYSSYIRPGLPQSPYTSRPPIV